MITVTAKVVVPKCSFESTDKKRVFIVHNPMVEPMKLSTLSQRISKYKRTQIKDKKIAECKAKMCGASLKFAREALEVLEDLYGDLAFEEL